MFKNVVFRKIHNAIYPRNIKQSAINIVFKRKNDEQIYLIAKLKAWNTPFKRKGLLFIKKSYLNLFLAHWIFKQMKTLQNLAWLKSKVLIDET